MTEPDKTNIMNQMKRIYLIDGSSLLFRTYFALPPLMTTKGEPTGAVYGFVRILLNILENNSIDYIGVSFDKGKPTFRLEKLPEYKAQRPKPPEEISIQKERLKQVLDAFGISVIEIPGFEGDDIIGTIKKMAEKENLYTVIVTGDRDLLQLLTDNSEVLLTKKGISQIERVTREDFIKKYGIEPLRLSEIKALTGDKSDNIPGVPGIGEKTAITLLKKYGSLEKLIENPPKGRIGDLIKRYKDQILTAKEITTIRTNVPINLGIEDLRKREIDRRRLLRLFSELEFDTLLEKFTLKKEKIPLKEVEEKKFLSHKEISFIVKKDAVYFYSDSGIFKGSKMDFDRIVNSRVSYTHGFKEELLYLFPFNEKRNVFDTEIAAYLLNPSRKTYSLSSLFPLYLGESLSFEKEEELLPKILSLGRILKKKIEEENLTKILYEVELPLSHVLSEMEIVGIKVDKKKLVEIRNELRKRVIEIVKEISDISGFSINPASPKQVSYLLFEKLGLPKIKKTKSGYSTDQETLFKLKELHPVVDKILEFREINKLLTTYFEVLPKLADENDRIHTRFIQTGTATGRLASREPNLQNIPIRSEIGKKVRESFIAEDGFLLGSFDYSQIELRILAHFSKDERLIKAFREGKDIHRETASSIFGVPPDKVTKSLRRKAKTINYGIIYGMSPHGLAKELGISDGEAKKYIDRYFERFSGVRKFIDETIEKAKKNGYVETILGRKRYVPELNSKNYNTRKLGERIAINSPIQGSGADIIKIAMVNVWRKLRDKKSRIVLQIHDELLVEIKEEEANEVKEMVKREMENTLSLDVPIIVDAGIGKNWLECKT